MGGFFFLSSQFEENDNHDQQKLPLGHIQLD